MRLDKYLKVARIIKRRTVAKEVGDADRITVNDRIAKPSTVLKVGDIVSLRYLHKHLVFRVVSLQATVKKEDAKMMYEIIEIHDE
ncbi:MAG TPA: RNA-binding S4 domain-containing protein [Bacilli bacterium]|nr:MAG: ribosome-associated heat shock protein Hsp15 [Tenericutes bacterium ADurb.BinA124]HOH17760.1 RNA-binding S4 domain-containing protein [Bacilli bacterium]HPN60503.1 RNA-binding S4 domain-containing protein [Bacilli bacterium]HPX84002.1 RNA-binding S4 domain-containing protein [Bacilli bacterium]HQC74102.1 RNA-binding S4 domain-containing protein [Bacilli bacterium]